MIPIKVNCLSVTPEPGLDRPLCPAPLTAKGLFPGFTKGTACCLASLCLFRGRVAVTQAGLELPRAGTTGIPYHTWLSFLGLLLKTNGKTKETSCSLPAGTVHTGTEKQAWLRLRNPSCSQAPPPSTVAPPLRLLGEVTSQRDGGGSFRQLKGDLGPEDPSPSAAGRGRAGPAGAGAAAAALGLSHPPRIEALRATGRPESDGESGAVRGAESDRTRSSGSSGAASRSADPGSGRAGSSEPHRCHGAEGREQVPTGPQDRQRLLRRHLSR